MKNTMYDYGGGEYYNDGGVIPLPVIGASGRQPAEKDKLLSEERGSGARFNAGKPDYSLVPLKLMAESLIQERPDSVAAKALFLLGFYQTSRDVHMLYAAARELGHPGWAECAQVFSYGRDKYAPWNWAKGMPWSAPLSSAVRHLVAMLAGESDDAESGLPHRGHVFCNLVMLLTYSAKYVEGDDFAPAGALV